MALPPGAGSRPGPGTSPRCPRTFFPAAKCSCAGSVSHRRRTWPSAQLSEPRASGKVAPGPPGLLGERKLRLEEGLEDPAATSRTSQNSHFKPASSSLNSTPAHAFHLLWSTQATSVYEALVVCWGARGPLQPWRRVAPFPPPPAPPSSHSPPHGASACVLYAGSHLLASPAALPSLEAEKPSVSLGPLCHILDRRLAGPVGILAEQPWGVSPRGTLTKRKSGEKKGPPKKSYCAPSFPLAQSPWLSR